MPRECDGALNPGRSQYCVHEPKGKLKLCHPDTKIQNVLVITRLSLVFGVYPTEREAVESFTPGECEEIQRAHHLEWGQTSTTLTAAASP